VIVLVLVSLSSTVAGTVLLMQAPWYWGPLLGVAGTALVGAFLLPFVEGLTRAWIWLFTLAMQNRDDERGDAWQYAQQMEDDLQNRGYRPLEIGLRLLLHLVLTIPGDSACGVQAAANLLSGWFRPLGVRGRIAVVVVTAAIVLVISSTYGASLISVVHGIVWMVAGFGAMAMTMRINYRRWQALSLPLLAFTLTLLLLVLTPHVGHADHGVRRWFALGNGMALEPSGLIKFSIVIYLASWLTMKKAEVRDLKLCFVPFSLFIGLVCLLIVKQPDLGSTVLVASIAFSMFIAAGGNHRYLVTSAAGALVDMCFLIHTTSSTRQARMVHFLDQLLQVPDTTVHGLLSPHSGSMRGQLAVLVVCLLISFQGIRVSYKASDRFGRLLSAGITSWLAWQAFMNYTYSTAMSSTVSLSPFSSYGATAFVTSMAAIGILLNISRTSRASIPNELTAELPEFLHR
jgi:cell division protein FtsW